AATPAQRPPTAPWARLTALAEVFLASGFPTQLGVGALLVLAGLRPWDPAGGLSMRYLITLLLVDTIVVATFLVVVLRMRGESPAGLFLGIRPRGREVWVGLCLVPLVIGGTAAALGLIRALWPWLHNVPLNPFESAIRSPLDAVLLGTAAVIGGGVKEELQRAFVLRRFEQHLGGARVGLVLYSLVFGAGHAIQGWDVGIITALLGLVWGIVFLWRRSAVASMVSHSGFNAAQILQFTIVGS
ncbi:MAG: CPBP family intramembrane metalloprotease, partial [Vicinamibacterales bacterium]|nr:CPBP family intramembrane metalloprotease [Vicinamibacterales bacterium]